MIDDLRCFQYFITSQPILTMFQSAHGNQVDLALENGLQFLLHFHMIKQSPVSRIVRSNQNIYITVRLEIISQDGAKQGQLTYMPAMAKTGDFSF